jgi:hypothetical protein
MKPPNPKPRNRRFWGLAVLAAVSLALLPGGANGQTSDPEFRIGISAGGVGLWGVLFEYRWNDTALDVNVSTFSFKDLSVSVAAKRYFGGGDLRPFLGIGLWGVSGRPEEDPRNGFALLAIAPIGADWSVLDNHALGATLNLNEGLWVRRSDPTDPTPISHRIIPLPGFYYRYTVESECDLPCG